MKDVKSFKYYITLIFNNKMNIIIGTNDISDHDYIQRKYNDSKLIEVISPKRIYSSIVSLKNVMVIDLWTSEEFELYNNLDKIVISKLYKEKEVTINE